MQQKPKIGIAAICLKDRKILLGKRLNSHGANLYAPPGGHLEFGETPEECAKRELLEETGMIALSITKGPWVNNFIEDKHYITLAIFITDFEGEPQLLEPDKCEEWQFFDVENLPNPLFPSLINIFQEINLTTLEGMNKVNN